MKKLLLIGLVCLLSGMAGIPGAWAQEKDPVWEQVKAVNLPEKSLKASWHRVFRSEMLTEELVSEGTVELRQPDYLRWETLSPVQRVTEMDANAPRGRFKLPQEKDFSVSVRDAASDNAYLVVLSPVRRDLKQMIREITLTVDRDSYVLRYVTILDPDQNFTRIDFSHIVKE